MDITSILRASLFACFSLFLVSCGSDEETVATNLTPGFHDLKINFSQEEKDLGKVTIQPSNLVCNTTCTSNIADGTLVDLIATPKGDAIFVSWGGSCSGSTTCQVTMSSEHTVTATFTDASSVFSLSLLTTEGGSVTLADDLGECSTDCEFKFISSQSITLSATPATNHIFMGWTGACSGNSTCQVTMSEARIVTALFEKESAFTLTTELSTGGSIHSKDGSLACEDSCKFNVAEAMIVDIIATPEYGYAFKNWQGDCTGTGACQMTIDGAKVITVNFEAKPIFTLNTSNSSGGSISLKDGTLACAADTVCNFNIVENEAVIIKPLPARGYIFTGWTGACTGISGCNLTMSANQSVVATFIKIPTDTGKILSLQMSTGGSIALADALGECFIDCQLSFSQNETITATAKPDAGYAFTGWSGDCQEDTTCQVTMSAAHSITATFIEIPTGKLLSLKMSSGGSIFLADGLGQCFDNCQLGFSNSENITAIAKPDAGSAFTHWQGDCDNLADTNCQVTMSTDRSIIATFKAIPTFSLTTSVSLGGSISLINDTRVCDAGKDCSYRLLENESVIVKPIPKAGYIFTGWDSQCDNVGETTCQVTMTTDRSITATFVEESIERILSLTIDPGGLVAFSDTTENCTTDCQITYTAQDSVTLTAVPQDGYVFYAWSGACAGDSGCLVNMSTDKAVTAIFKATSHSCNAQEQAPLPGTSFDADAEFPYHNPANNGSPLETFLTDFTVKESSGKGATNYPVSMVFPVEQGLFFHPGDFHIRNSAGEVVPAQFNVINRWWAQDRSLRHIQAHFTVDIEPYTVGQANTGLKTFNLYAGNANIKPNYSVCTTESVTDIVLNNGLIDITITKSPLTITTPAGQLKSLFVKENGDNNYSFDHANIEIELEEIGYLRTIVKISSLTNYVSPTDIKHGWAIRLFMYANSDKVKVDFQLQNSALNAVISAPLYFDSHQLVLDNTGSTGSQSVKADSINAEKISSGLSGAISAPKVNVFFRDFWQKFPQGLTTKTDGKLSIELWPTWSKQFFDKDFAAADLYWLDDMKQTYKEVLLDFSNKKQADYLDTVARNFQYSPLASLPQAYYAKTSVTLELGGYFPTTAIPNEESRLPLYNANDFSEPFWTGHYLFGLDNYGLDLSRKRSTNAAGGWPYSERAYFITGNPKDYYAAQKFAKAEINIRPQWISGYTHDNNYSSLKPSSNPYGGSTWRIFKGSYIPTLTRDYLTGSSQVAYPRDDQHAWFYHVEHAYLMSGNKWLKDWYQFMAEFKKVYLQELDPYPDKVHRAEGHNLNVAIAAYRMTNNQGLGDLLINYANDIHSKTILAPHNINGNLEREFPNAAVFQLGYLVKPFIELTYEFPNQAVTLGLIKNYIDWNFSYSNFSYYVSVVDYEVRTVANETGLSFVDVPIWYSIHSGDPKYAEHAINYVQLGIGGIKPYGKFSLWDGQYEAQIYNYYLQSNN